MPGYAAMKEKLEGIYELEVIGDFGGQSAKPFLPKSDDFKVHMKKLIDERRGKKRLMAANIPVVSKSLKVGQVTEEEAKDVPYHMIARPVFIVGYDPVSLNWLDNNSQFLAEKNAIGFVVNVETVAQMNELQAVAGKGILLQPTPGDRFAEQMNIRHYPFYLDSDGVMR